MMMSTECNWRELTIEQQVHCQWIKLLECIFKASKKLSKLEGQLVVIYKRMVFCKSSNSVNHQWQNEIIVHQVKKYGVTNFFESNLRLLPNIFYLSRCCGARKTHKRQFHDKLSCHVDES
jgi:hypothetical protein